MKKYHFCRTVLASVLCGAMILSFTSCKSPDSKSESKAAASGGSEVTTLKGVTIVPSSVGDYTKSRLQQAMVKATGVKVNWDVISSDKMNVLLAGGDLPDLLIVSDSYFKQLIEGDNVVAMDDLFKDTKSVTKTIPKTIELSKKFWSDGQNKTYFLPVQVGKDGVGAEQVSGLVLRWDYYKELGYPEINNIDDALSVINKMVKAHPKAENGKKVFGLSGWTDWGTWNYTYPMSALMGYYQTNSPTVELNVVSNEMDNVLMDENSPYWQSVKYYYKANQMGILDPDTFTQKNSDFTTKATNGQYASIPAQWASGDFNSNNAKDGKGFVVIPLKWGCQWGEATNVLGYTDKCYAISKNCKNPQAAMKFIDYVYSYDGCRTMYSGFQGTDWTANNGKPALKDSTLALSKSGGTEWKNTGIGYDSTFIGLSGFTTNPGDNASVNLFDDTSTFPRSLSNLQTSFCKHYNVSYPNEIFQNIVKQGKVKNQSGENTLALALMPPETNDIGRFDSNLGTIAAQYGAKLSLAKNDSEFASLKQQAMAAFKQAGSDKVFDWYNTNWADCVKKSSSMQ